VIPKRTSLTESKIAIDRQHYGKHRTPSRDILDVPKTIPTSEGHRQRGSGIPHYGRNIRNIQNWRSGEDRTEKKAPTNPERASYRRRSFLRKGPKRKLLRQSLIPPRLPLLIDWLGEG
jgi:hypothetical protein